jgi:carbon starvation protein CstA
MTTQIAPRSFLSFLVWLLILFCSTRRRGKSLGQMVREEVGPFAGFITLISVVAIMVILLAVLALVVVKALAESPWGRFTILASMPIGMAIGVGLQLVAEKEIRPLREEPQVALPAA